MTLDHGARLCGVSISVPDPEAYAAFFAKNFQVPHDAAVNSLKILSGAELRVNKWSSGQIQEDFEAGEVSACVLCFVIIYSTCVDHITMLCLQVQSH